MFLSSINIKLSDQVEKKGTPYLGIVTEDESTELDSLRREVSVIDYDRAMAVKKAETKLSRLEIMVKFDKKKRDVLEKESLEVKLLYKIYELDSNIVLFQKVIKIKQIANEAIRKLVDKGIIETEAVSRIRKNLIRRGKKQYVSQFKKEAFKKFALGERGNLIPKV